MKLQYTTQDKKFTVELEGDSHTELWEELAAFQEVFEEGKCSKCNGTNLRNIVRKDKEDNKYYELHCLDTKCRAKLSYGCHKKNGGLFPKRFKEGEKEGDKKEVRGAWGWVKWNHEKKCEE